MKNLEKFMFHCDDLRNSEIIEITPYSKVFYYVITFRNNVDKKIRTCYVLRDSFIATQYLVENFYTIAINDKFVTNPESFNAMYNLNIDILTFHQLYETFKDCLDINAILKDILKSIKKKTHKRYKYEKNSCLFYGIF